MNSLSQHWMQLRKLSPTLTGSTETTPWPLWHAFKGHVYLFGIEWEFLPDLDNKNKELQTQRRFGKKYYASSNLDDVIGYVGTLPTKNGKKYAAALQLADQHSQGGIEIFCFHLRDDLYSVIALNDAKPVPGHDYMGNKESVWQLANDYANLQEQQSIRYAGNSGLFQMEESLNPESLFAIPSDTARFKPILNQPLLIRLAVLLLLLMAVFYGLDAYVTHLNDEKEKILHATLNDPDRLYQQNIETSLRQLPAGGRQSLEVWLQTIGKLPLNTAGWQLTQVNCNPNECTARWQRQYGNFQDLFRNLPLAYTQKSENLETGKTNPSTATTHHALIGAVKPFGLGKKQLPGIQDAMSQIGSQMQDLSLLKHTSISLNKPEIFPTQPAEGQRSIRNPVMRAVWGLDLDLWTIDSLELESHVVPETLEIRFSHGGQNQSLYSLKGSLYALGQ